MKIWDPRNTSVELFQNDLDTASGVIMPFFDCDTNVMYLSGKGDGNVRSFDISPEGDTCSVTALFDFRSSVAAKGMAMVPKRGLNVTGNETARLLKLTTSTIEPLSFIVPRKAEGFQEDIFPDSFSGEPSHSSSEWLLGSDKPPMLASLNPSLSGSKSPGSPVKGLSRVQSVKTMPVLLAELDRANARIRELEERLLAANLSIE
jgi:coronin-1B/1C/6